MVQTGGAGHLSPDTASGVFEVDLSGTYDWKAQGVNSTDPVSGLQVLDGGEPGDVSDFTTLEVGSGVITFDAPGTGQDVAAKLDITIPGFPAMNEATLFSTEVDLDLDDGAGNFDTDSDVFYVVLKNSDSSEFFTGGLWGNGAGDIRIRVDRIVNGAAANGTLAIVANAKNAGTLKAVDNIGHQYAQFYEPTGDTLVQGGALTQTTMHSRSGATILSIYMRAKDGGQVKGTISKIKVMMK